MLKFFIREITDFYVKENFEAISRWVREQNILRGEWKFVEVSVDGAVTEKKIKHGLNCIPKDIIQTYKVGAGSATWEYDKFDREFIYLTTTGQCVVRAFVGLYKEE